MPVKYYRDQDDELWLLVPEFRVGKGRLALYKQNFWFNGFTSMHWSPALMKFEEMRFREVPKSDLNYLELRNVEEWLAEEEYWRTWDELRRTSMVFGKTWEVIERFHREAGSIWS